MAPEDLPFPIQEVGNPIEEDYVGNSDKDSDDVATTNTNEAQIQARTEGAEYLRRPPYEEILITWTSKRKNLAAEHHKVITKLELDKTALLLKVKGRDLRFLRVEFALVSGIKFGPAKFNPYMMHQIPVDSVYTRLLERKTIVPVYLHTKFIDMKFIVNKVEVKGSEADYPKLAKVLMASMYVIGLDPNKTKISNWMWVLVEDKESLQQFPWGSMHTSC
ncbi:hypothetical protein OROMI_004700 [Orobanche minor]